MRNRRRTIESLRRLAERPGTPAEGETARRLLERMGASAPMRPGQRVFSLTEFPRGARVWYAYWSYDNAPGEIVCNAPNAIEGKLWMRIKFDYLTHPRWVPVTSALGCHLSRSPFEGEEAKALYHMDWDWEEKAREFMQRAGVTQTAV